MFFLRLLTLSFVLLMAEGDAYSQLRKEAKREPLINEWGIGYGAGSPFGATEWRSVKNSEFTQKFSQMWQLNIGHQFSSKDYGAASKGYYYPTLGMFFQWLDYSHLKIQGVEPIIPKSKTADYGQIATFGITLHQYCWTSGKWRGYLNQETGAAYVFNPVYEVPSWVTLSKPWQTDFITWKPSVRNLRISATVDLRTTTRVSTTSRFRCATDTRL